MKAAIWGLLSYLSLMDVIFSHSNFSTLLLVKRARMVQSSGSLCVCLCVTADLRERSRLRFLSGGTANYERRDKIVTSILHSADPGPAGEQFVIYED